MSWACLARGDSYQSAIMKLSTKARIMFAKIDVSLKGLSDWVSARKMSIRVK